MYLLYLSEREKRDALFRNLNFQYQFHKLIIIDILVWIIFFVGQIFLLHQFWNEYVCVCEILYLKNNNFGISTTKNEETLSCNVLKLHIYTLVSCLFLVLNNEKESLTGYKKTKFTAIDAIFNLTIFGMDLSNATLKFDVMLIRIFTTDHLKVTSTTFMVTVFLRIVKYQALRSASCKRFSALVIHDRSVFDYSRFILSTVKSLRFELNSSGSKSQNRPI
jgi:hypothetical protein